MANITCSKCGVNAPENVSAIGEWQCPNHTNKSLPEAITELMNEPHTVLYMSILTPNHIVANKLFNDSKHKMTMGFTLTLTMPEAYAMLMGVEYSHIFVDNNVVDQDYIIEKLSKKDGCTIYHVNPETQLVTSEESLLRASQENELGRT